MINDKVTIELRMRQCCTGCGTQFFCANYLEPIVWLNEHYALDIIKRAKAAIERAECTQCQKQFNGVEVQRDFGIDPGNFPMVKVPKKKLKRKYKRPRLWRKRNEKLI